MSRHINQAGLNLIKQWEGLFLHAYHGAADRPGLLTIGYGHTSAQGAPEVVEGMTITESDAENILRSDLRQCEAVVERHVKVSLSDNQFAALVSFVLNVGEKNFANSTLLRKLNAGDYDVVPAELSKWTKANGKQVTGLANRRAAEAGLWVKGGTISSQYIEPTKTHPIVDALSSPSVITTTLTSAGGIFGALSQTSGPVSWAIAGCILLAAAIGGFYILMRVRDRSQ